MTIAENGLGAPIVLSEHGAPFVVDGLVRFYVDPAGSDSNDGLSPGSAWQTLGKVNAETIPAGAQVLFKGGETFLGSLVLREGQHYGLAGATIVYGSYGTGKATIQASSNSESGVDALNPHDVTIRDLSFVGTGSTVSTGCGVHAQNNLLDGSKLPGLRLINLEVSAYGIDGIAIRTGDDAVAAEAASGFDAPLIDGCVVHDCTGNTVTNRGMGIVVRGLHGLKLYDVSTTDPIVQNCTVYNCTGKTGLGNHSGNGIFVGEGISGGLVQYCLAYDNGANGSGSVGIWMADCLDTVIQFCVTRGQRTSFGSSDGGGFDIDGGSQGCIIQYCYAVDCDGPGYLLYQWNAGGTHLLPLNNNTIRYCISENNSASDTDKYGEFMFGSDEASDASGNFIYGNTFYNDHDDGFALMVYSGTTNRFINGGFFNNILVAASGKVVTSKSSVVPASSFLIRGNLYWPSGAAISIKWGATTYSSIAAWRAATGTETDGGIDISIPLDPMFAGTVPVGNVDAVNDPALAAYQTQIGSGARGHGQDILALVGITPPRDFFGNVVPQNDYDIGCFESETITPLPLSLTGSPVTTGEVGLAYAGFTATAFYGTAPYTYSLAGDWPDGISIDPSTGAVSGTPTEHGTFADLNVQVTDANMDTAQLSSSFTLTVLRENLLRALAWVQGPNTVLTDQGNGRMRIARSGANPKAWKEPSLTPGATYRLYGNVYINGGWGSGAVRVCDTGTFNSGTSFTTANMTANVLIDTTFVALDTAAWFLGMLLFTGTVDGRYMEFDKDFRLELVSLPFSPLSVREVEAWWTAKPFSGGNWTDERAGHALDMTGAVYNATGWPGTNASCVSFDGIDDFGVLDIPAFVPVGADPGFMLLVVNQKRLSADGNHNTMFGYGDSGATSRTVGRRVTSTVNRAKADTGDGLTGVERQYTSVDFSGAHVLFVEHTGTQVNYYVDGGAAQSSAVVPATVNNRLHIGAAPHSPPGAFSLMDVRDAIVGVGLLSSSDRAALMAWAMARAGLG
ncbi:putative Ig domain-containing protein [Devosia nitrariae]